jgi:transcriptional regulator with XRE-family HTH domain
MNGKHIGNFIKFKREELGLTIEQFCATLGVPRSIVESWEKGEIPETQYLVPISQVLHASVDELLKGRQENEEEKVESVLVTPALKTEQASFPQAKQNPPTIQEEKGYYEKLNEKISKTDYANYQSIEPHGEDGFGDGERKFGFILCGLMLAIVLLINVVNIFNFVTRPRELTLENYRQFLEVDVSALSSANNKGLYEVRISKKKNAYDVENLQITVEIEFQKLMNNSPNIDGNPKETRQVTISDELFTDKEVLKQTVTLPSVMYIERDITVISVSGVM